VFEPGFSESSYGFRPGRNAGQAVQKAREYVEAGHHWVVDIDLEAFFDRVNHDMLMARVLRELDGWIRRHLRQILWLHWKRSFPRAKNLMRLGLSEKAAWNTAQSGRGKWGAAGSRLMNVALPSRLFARLGPVSLVNTYHQLNRLHEPPWYGTVCPVVWEDGGSNPVSYPMLRQGLPGRPGAPSRHRPVT